MRLELYTRKIVINWKALKPALFHMKIEFPVYKYLANLQDCDDVWVLEKSLLEFEKCFFLSENRAVLRFAKDIAQVFGLTPHTYFFSSSFKLDGWATEVRMQKWCVNEYKWQQNGEFDEICYIILCHHPNSTCASCFKFWAALGQTKTLEMQLVNNDGRHTKTIST